MLKQTFNLPTSKFSFIVWGKILIIVFHFFEEKQFLLVSFFEYKRKILCVAMTLQLDIAE